MPRASTPDLHDSEQRFATLVDSIKDYAVFMLSPEGIVLTWNQGARRLKGYAPEEIIGQSFERFYTEPDRSAGRPKYLLGLAQAEGRVEDEGWRVRSDGTRFWADVVITALRDQDGELLGYAKVTRDLTERLQAEQDRAARQAAERAAQRVERLQAATAALAAAIHPESAADVLADVAVRSLSAASGAVSLTPLDGGAPQLIATRGDFEGVPTADQPMWRPDEATVPLILDHHVLGVLAIRFEPARALDPDERGFLLALAEVGAQALDRARLYAAERAARTEAQAAERAAREEAQLVE